VSTKLLKAYLELILDILSLPFYLVLMLIFKVIEGAIEFTREEYSALKELFKLRIANINKVKGDA